MSRNKRIFTAALALVLVLMSVLPACAAESGFRDVSADAWYAGAVSFAVDRGLMVGTGQRRFSPNAATSRAMLVTVLWRQNGSPAPGTDTVFSDTKADGWYAKALSWAVENGVIDGYGDDRFGPNDPVTRQQLAAILWRCAGKPAGESGDFADQEKISAWAAEAVAWAKSVGLVNGKSGNCFDPGGKATRAETAAILQRRADLADPKPEPDPVPDPDPEPDPAPTPAGPRVLVAVFSCTNHTADIGEKIAACLDADLWPITPAEPYTAADLNYNSDCRANREQNDPSARPAIQGQVENWESYDTVFLGYPIWWGVAPKIIHTFLESYDFGGKTVIPFCTSGSSSYNDSTIRGLVGEDTNWVTGCRFATGASRETVRSWLDTLPLQKEQRLTVRFNGHSYTATLADNPSAAAFAAYIRAQGGSVTVEAHDYGNFEKVGPLGTSIVTTDEPIDTVPGDLILYQGENICLYYSTNHWNFTRLGKLEGDLSSLKADLGSGNVSIIYSLEN